MQNRFGALSRWCGLVALALLAASANQASNRVSASTPPPPPINLTAWRISDHNGAGTAIGRLAAADADKDGDTDFMGIFFGYGNTMVFADNLSTQWGTNPDGTPKLVVSINDFNRQVPKFFDANGDGYLGYVVTDSDFGLAYRDRDANGYVGGGETQINVQWCATCDGFGGPRYGQMTQIDVGDIDGDGSQDIVAIGSRWNPNIRVFLNHGGTLDPGAVIPYPGGTWDGTGVKLADLDGDGKLDIVFSKLVEPGSPPAPNLYRNNGDGTFTAANLPLILCTGTLAVADANGDGRPDIFMNAIAENNPDGSFIPGSGQGVWLFTNNGGLNFSWSKALTPPAGQSVYGMDAGDLNGDGFADIVESYYDSTAWPTPMPKVYAGDGTGSFTEVWSGGLWGADGINIIKYNGRPAIATSGYNGVSYLYANFNPPETFSWVAGDYGACSASCGGGTQFRTVTCMGSNGTVDNTGASCTGPAPASIQACNVQACPVDCAVSAWSAWGSCSASCGGGTQTRTRSILVSPAGGGLACPGLTDVQACNTQSCDSDSDGVPDSGDSCPATPAGAKVDAAGCSGPQLVAAACPTIVSYKNHGAYVSCVSRKAESLVIQGLITSAQKNALVSTAAQSDIGKK